jgi:small subunit ribosomal protein S20
MAHSASARKRIRQNASRRALNRWRKGSMRDALKTFRDRMTKGTVEEAREAMREASTLIDKTAQKGAVHKNAAARTKSRMSAALAKKEAEAAA